MIEAIRAQCAAFREEMLRFAQKLVRTKSLTGAEGEAIALIESTMKELGYDEAAIDGMGNVVGRIGSGPKKLLFDSHVDTVAVTDTERWTVDPFGGAIAGGKLFGRGAVDMKASLAASVYAGAAVKKLGLAAGKTVYVSASVMEEDYDGEALIYEFTEGGLRPDYVVICEPSACGISFGQKGRALVRIEARGVSAHGSAPEKGDNPIYKMALIAQRVDELGKRFMRSTGKGPSIAMTGVVSESGSLNAIPSTCVAFADRRLVPGEDEEAVKKEMEALLGGTGATWSFHEVVGSSWKGRRTVLRSFLPAWEIDAGHELAVAASRAYQELKGKAPVPYRWDFSTNGVASATKMGIPTIGFGAGDSKLAHCVDEHCPVEDIVTAAEFYANLVRNI